MGLDLPTRRRSQRRQPLDFHSFSAGLVLRGVQDQKRINTETIAEELKTTQTGWLIIPLALVVAFFFGLFPKMDSATSLTMAFRTGPDAIGTAIASEALLRDGSKSALTRKIMNDTSFGSLEDLFTDSNLYRTASFSQQVKTEFVLSSAPKLVSLESLQM